MKSRKHAGSLSSEATTLSDPDTPLLDIAPECSHSSVSLPDRNDAKPIFESDLPSSERQITTDDASIALEWIRTAPNSSNLSKGFRSNCVPQDVDDESLLLDFAFGDSSFSSSANAQGDAKSVPRSPPSEHCYRRCEQQNKV